MYRVKRAALVLGLWLAASTAVAQAGPVEGVVPDDFFLVGVAFGVTPGTRADLADETLWGVSVTHRWDWFGVGGRLMLDPVEVVRDVGTPDSDLERYRGLFGLHARAALRLGGIEWYYGVGAEAEARLQDHFWFVYVVPLEIGAVIWSAGSNHVELSAGLRVLAAGELVDVFLVDPNGFDNEVARDALDAEKAVRPEPFFGITFARRID